MDGANAQPAFVGYADRASTGLAPDGLQSGVVWRPIETAPLDGSDILILAHGMIVEARYGPGEWSHGIDGSEYDGPVWVCFDDQFQFEIEQIGPGPSDLYHGPVTHWAAKPAIPEALGKEA